MQADTRDETSHSQEQLPGEFLQILQCQRLLEVAESLAILTGVFYPSLTGTCRQQIQFLITGQRGNYRSSKIHSYLSFIQRLPVMPHKQVCIQKRVCTFLTKARRQQEEEISSHSHCKANMDYFLSCQARLSLFLIMNSVLLQISHVSQSEAFQGSSAKIYL